ncbi:hypothetical protein Desac_2190 [Desulfobacca acetoxidans DSM 11109]|uniref:Uncharacterized protein n=1 Tax=Desulfobacca acetoxidans (strain ATCC 700848 / DSM 11109 / ASRB2) TaxID=880072 RepID=F2NDF3_DESAR|nr:hypothetical protein Desac_2190 [Desulfobacca acetoxidans DSM 11109]
MFQNVNLKNNYFCCVMRQISYIANIYNMIAFCRILA